MNVHDIISMLTIYLPIDWINIGRLQDSNQFLGFFGPGFVSDHIFCLLNFKIIDIHIDIDIRIDIIIDLNIEMR